MLDPVQATTALTPSEHTALTPRLLRSALLTGMRDDALWQIHHAHATIAQPVREVDLLMIQKEPFVESTESREDLGADEHRCADHEIDVALAAIVPLAQAVAIGLGAEERQLSPRRAPQECLPPGIKFPATFGHRPIFVEQLRASHRHVGIGIEIIDGALQRACVDASVGIEKEQ